MCGLSYAEERIPSEVIDYGIYLPSFLMSSKCQTMLTHIQMSIVLPSDRFNNSKVISTEAIIGIFQIFSLHKVLMDLQNQQLKELNDWLTKTEERTRRMEKEPLGPDLEDLKRQVQQHKVSIFYAICIHLENKLCICVLRTYTCHGLQIREN